MPTAGTTSTRVEDEGTTLGHLVEVLGPSVLRILTTPGLDRVSAREVVVYDVAEPPVLRPGDVLLAVGVTATSDEACRVVREAGAAGVAAVVVRTRETDLPRLRRAATDSGLTLMALPAAMRWEQISVLVRNAIAVPASLSGDTTTGDLFGFADAVATAVGGAITIEDATNRVLAYSTIREEELDAPRREAILGRRVPDAYLQHLERSGVFRALRADDDVVQVDADERLGLRRRLVAAVRVHGDLLGSIWVQEGRLHLGQGAEAALAQAARTAPAHLLRAQGTGLSLRHRREDLLQGLLTGEADVVAAADALGFDPALPCAVLGVALDGTGWPGSEHDGLRRVDELFRARAMAFRWLAASVPSGGRLLVLVPELTGPPEQVHAGLERLGSSLFQDAERAGLAVRVACGPIAGRLADAAATTGTVDHLLRLLEREPARDRVATHESARAAVAVARAVDALAGVPELRGGPVATLLAYDRRHGTHYHRTLAAWLDSFGDNALAARALGIHANTVRYRLQRIVAVSGMRLDDGDERLAAMLHLRLVTGGDGDGDGLNV